MVSKELHEFYRKKGVLDEFFEKTNMMQMLFLSIIPDIIKKL